MEKFYTKEGKKYIPIGYCGAPDVYEGLWLVQFEESNRMHKNIVCRMDDLPNPIDMKALVKSTMCEESISKALLKLLKSGEVSIYNKTPQAISEIICKEIYTDIVDKKPKRK
jgi:hypothetical protein